MKTLQELHDEVRRIEEELLPLICERAMALIQRSLDANKEPPDNALINETPGQDNARGCPQQGPESEAENPPEGGP